MVYQGRAISYATYMQYAKKYNISLTKPNKSKKTINELAKYIYNYDMKYIYPKKGKYGLYVIK